MRRLLSAVVPGASVQSLCAVANVLDWFVHVFPSMFGSRKQLRAHFDVTPTRKETEHVRRSHVVPNGQILLNYERICGPKRETPCTCLVFRTVVVVCGGVCRCVQVCAGVYESVHSDVAS